MSLLNYINHIATAKSNLLADHQVKVCVYCSILVDKIEFSEVQLGEIYQAAMLHDIGKIGIPDSILLKPKYLSPQEWEIMKLHPTTGAELAEIGGCNQQVVSGILCHHERWDGEGYPLGLKGKEIPLIARIVAVADAYDAMTSDRPYRRALSHQEAVSELVRCKGEQFDPWLVDVFAKELDRGKIYENRVSGIIRPGYV